MRFSYIAVLAITLILSAAKVSRADAFDPHRVPADAKWLLHVDMDLLQKSKAWDLIDQRLQINLDFQNGVDQVGLITGMQFPKDLHDVTIYGTGADENDPVVIINADIDQEKFIGILKSLPTYSSSTYGDHEIHGWQDKEKQLYGAFTGKGLTILGRSEKNIQTALDTLDGKAECIAADAVIAGGSKAGVLAHVGGRDISSLNKKIRKNPFFHQVQSGWIAISADGDDLVLESNLIAKNAIAAEQIRAALEGIKAGVTMAGTAPEADTRAKLAAAAIANLTTKAHDKTVTVEGKVSLDAAFRMITELNSPATQPATEPDNN